MTKISTQSYKGVRDFYPKDKALQLALFTTIRNTLTKHGYEEYDASPLERAELYEAKTSEEIVSKQTYTFRDRGNRLVTLRPEMTPSLARMVAKKQRELPLPIRWFSIGNRFRYERTQKGRLREFYQIDVDMIGVPTKEADIEIILLSKKILNALGAADNIFEIRINSRKMLNLACEKAELDESERKLYLRLLDKKDKLKKAEFEEALSDLLGNRTDPLSLVENSTGEIAEEKNSLMEIISNLKERGADNIIFYPALTRGFDYYTGTVFEIFDTNSKNSRSLFGGGRYDDLISKFEGTQIPAMGFALGDVTLVDFLTEHNLLPTINLAANIYIATPDIKDVTIAQKFADILREQDLSVFVNLLDRPIKKQIKDALKREIKYVIVYGEKEALNNEVEIKNIIKSESEKVAKNKIYAYFSKTT